MLRVTVTKTGNWSLVNQRLRALAYEVPREAEKAAYHHAVHVARMVREGILSDTLDMTPLEPETIARKEALGVAHPELPLVRFRTYAEAIRMQRLGKGVFGVGVFNKELGEVGLAHEYGLGVPARPHFRPVFEMARASIRAVVAAGVMRALRRATRGL